ncbi:hypothetical protein M153_25760001865 [Pseudoloma neurophilia]|uniref:Uncharacterized protein n=1 Tax=Pseudoloma neurophilia TaxID=146866 RepID=A0A0R0LUB4_9MICR|nr:hypothetical protein M153_25760001865 [Pseudoloma neurophilia]
MNLSTLFNSVFHLVKTQNGVFYLKRDEKCYLIRTESEDILLEQIMELVNLIDEKNANEVEKNGLRVTKITSDVISDFIPVQNRNTGVHSTNPHKIEEVFGRSSGRFDPDIHPKYDQNIYRRKNDSGTYIDPNERFFRNELEKNEENSDLQVPEGARHDQMFPGKRKYRGPNPDHLRKPGNFPDNDFL